MKYSLWCRARIQHFGIALFIALVCHILNGERAPYKNSAPESESWQIEFAESSRVCTMSRPEYSIRVCRVMTTELTVGGILFK